MRWIKHMTRTWDDEKIARLVSEGGIEAYGFYWRMVEIIAAKIEDSSPALCQYPVKTWARLCNVLGNRWQRLANLSAKCGLLTAETFEGLCKVEIPTILKYRDEYSKKRGRSVAKNPDNIQAISEQCPAQRTDTDTDTDTDTELKKENKRKEPSRKLKFSDDDMITAEKMAQLVRNDIPGFTANLSSWANEIRRINEIDGKAHAEMLELFAFARGHSFWHKNILCPEKLRKQWNRLVLEQRSKPQPKEEPMDPREAKAIAEGMDPDILAYHREYGW